MSIRFSISLTGVSDKSSPHLLQISGVVVSVVLTMRELGSCSPSFAGVVDVVFRLPFEPKFFDGGRPLLLEFLRGFLISSTEIIISCMEIIDFIKKRTSAGKFLSFKKTSDSCLRFSICCLRDSLHMTKIIPYQANSANKKNLTRPVF